MDVRKLTNRDPDFYPTIGPFLANRQVEKTVGYPLYDDANKEWFVAIDGETVIGFCFLQRKSKTHYDIGSCYSPQDTKKIWRRLIRTAKKGKSGTITLTTQNKKICEVLTEMGFSLKRETKNCKEYVLETETKDE